MSSRLVRVLPSVLLGLLVASVSGQRYPGRSYTEQDGLPNSNVYDVAQDRAGRMWFLTRSGIGVWDGVQWERLSPEIEEFGRYGRRILRAGDEMWLVRPDGAVARLGDGPVRYLPPFRALAILEEDEIDDAVPLLDGATGLAVATKAGAWIHDGLRWHRASRREGLPSDEVRSVAVWQRGVLLGTDRGLFEFRDGEIAPFATGGDGVPPEVNGLAVEPLTAGRHRLWIVGKATAHTWDGDTLRLIGKLPYPPATASDVVHVEPDRMGGAYVGGAGGLLHLASSGEIAWLGRRNGVISDQATMHRLDREGLLWIATPVGVTKLIGRRVAAFDRDHGLYDHEVSAIVERANGDLVFGHVGGLTIRADDAQRVVPFARDPGESLLLSRVMDLHEDRNGGLWIAGARKGLGRQMGDGTILWRLLPGIRSHCNAVRTDPSGGLVVGTSHGLFAVSDAEPRPLAEDLLAGRTVRRIEFARDGTLLGAVAVQGVLVGNGDRFSLLRSTEGGAADDAFTVFEDRSGVRWAGTAGGLLRIGTGGLERPDGGPDVRRPVYSLAEDRAGRLWIGTDFGVFVWYEGALEHLTVRSGLAGHDCNRAALLVDARGDVWIGCDRGVTRCQPPLSVVDGDAPSIDRLTVGVGRTEHDASLPVSIPSAAGEIVLRARMITFVDESRVRYRVRLRGFENEWRDVVGSTWLETRYTNLPPGDYSFEVSGTDARGVASAVFVSAPIRIVGPFWRRAWVLMLSSGGLLAAMALGWRLVRQRAWNRRLANEVADRTAELAASRQVVAREKERLAVTLASIADGVVVMDAGGAITLMNRAAERMAGVSEAAALGRPLHEVLPLDSVQSSPAADAVAVSLAAPSSEPLPVWRLEPRDGEARLVEVAAAPVGPVVAGSTGAVVALRDVSIKKRFEEEALRARRLESLGMLAGGIAHDFNNVLTAVVGNLSLLRRQLERGERGTDRLADVDTAVGRARDLSRQLLTFATGGVPIKEPVSLATLVRDSAQLAFAGSDIELELELSADLWPVEVDALQIRQVVDNLLLNARQAMPNGGRVAVRGANEEVVETGSTAPRPGRFVRLAIEDEGPGIPEEQLDRIFDPFFTTRATGVGLGLAIVYSVLNRHGGTVAVESAPGIGTRFRLWIPAASSAVAPCRDEAKRAEPTGLRILVMDDDPTVRRVLSDMLALSGHASSVVGDGAEAIAAIRDAVDRGRPFDCAILDLTVPGGIGGAEALQILRDGGTEVRAIASSGYSDDPVMARHAEFGFCGMLPKPYRLADVARVLAEVLSGATVRGDDERASR